MHKSLVFLSCGQRGSERGLAKSVEKMIRDDLDMDCYNADSVHDFDDVMSITEKLTIADYYVMIDFRRDDEAPLSVFTHQEFALARAWGLDRILVFHEKDQTSPSGGSPDQISYRTPRDACGNQGVLFGNERDDG